MRVLRWLQSVDRRLVYLALCILLIVPLVADYALRVYPSTYTRHFFDGLERVAADPLERDKIVLVLTNWGPGTAGENEPQFESVMRHLLRLRLPIVFLCTAADPIPLDTALLVFERAQAAERLRARRLGLPPPQWVYGEDWLCFGYRNAPVFTPLARTVITTPRQFYGQDYLQKRDLNDDASFPLLARFRGMQDVSSVLIISAGDEAKDVAGLVKPEFPHLRVATATMGIVANDLYPYVRSGQLFGLLNSMRGATEYRALLDPEAAYTGKIDNAMSIGKVFLLALVLLGNVAFLAVRWAERTGRLEPLPRAAVRPPLPPLPRSVMWGMFAVVVIGFGVTGVMEWSQHRGDGAVPRLRPVGAEDDPAVRYARYERVTPEQLADEARADAGRAGDPLAQELADAAGQARFAQLREQRIGEFIAAILTLGVLAFLLGDNRFYRVTEAIIIGSAFAFLLVNIETILLPDWIQPIVAGLTGTPLPGQSRPAHWTNVLWVLLAVPGALWYFVYSKRYAWLNQVIVAAFIGLVLGNEFEKQTGNLIPQIVDSVQPVWPLTSTSIEHIIFVLVAVLSLSYFVFSFRPRGRAGNGLLTAGRLAMMLGFGVMFGNTVNTRLSWLVPRIAFLWDEWLGKLGAS
jgi:hypothetical protein